MGKDTVIKHYMHFDKVGATGWLDVLIRRGFSGVVFRSGAPEFEIDIFLTHQQVKNLAETLTSHAYGEVFARVEITEVNNPGGDEQ